MRGFLSRYPETEIGNTTITPEEPKVAATLDSASPIQELERLVNEELREPLDLLEVNIDSFPTHYPSEIADYLEQINREINVPVIGAVKTAPKGEWREHPKSDQIIQDTYNQAQKHIEAVNIPFKLEDQLVPDNLTTIKHVDLDETPQTPELVKNQLETLQEENTEDILQTIYPTKSRKEIGILHEGLEQYINTGNPELLSIKCDGYAGTQGHYNLPIAGSSITYGTLNSQYTKDSITRIGRHLEEINRKDLPLTTPGEKAEIEELLTH